MSKKETNNESVSLSFQDFKDKIDAFFDKHDLDTETRYFLTKSLNEDYWDDLKSESDVDDDDISDDDVDSEESDYSNDDSEDDDVDSDNLDDSESVTSDIDSDDESDSDDLDSDDEVDNHQDKIKSRLLKTPKVESKKPKIKIKR